MVIVLFSLKKHVAMWCLQHLFVLLPHELPFLWAAKGSWKGGLNFKQVNVNRLWF